jgi:hypothetical protein
VTPRRAIRVLPEIVETFRHRLGQHGDADQRRPDYRILITNTRPERLRLGPPWWVAGRAGVGELILGAMEPGAGTVDVAGPESVGMVVTGAQMVAGHVSLDVSCLDRLYLTGFVAKPQTPGGVIYFLHNRRGNPIASPALFEKIGNKFRADMNAWAQANGVPVVTFKACHRKADVMAPCLQAAADAGVRGPLRQEALHKDHP